MQSIYESGEYLKKHPTWHGEDSLWKARQITRILPYRFLVQNFRNKKLSMIDIGCGTGGVLGYMQKILASKGYRIEPCKGIDIADDALRMARRKWPDIEFANSDPAGVTEHFNVGLLIDVIEHLENPVGFVRSCCVFCDFLIFHIPLEDNYNVRIRAKHPHYLEDVGHLHYFNHRTALSFLKMNHLRIIDSKFTKVFLSSNPTMFAKLALPARSFLSLISEPVCAKILGGLSLIVLTECLQ